MVTDGYSVICFCKYEFTENDWVFVKGDKNEPTGCPSCGKSHKLQVEV